jgi:hypothetical protein
MIAANTTAELATRIAGALTSFQLARNWHYIYGEFFCNLFLALTWSITLKRSFSLAHHHKKIFLFHNITREKGYATWNSRAQIFEGRFVFVNANDVERIH